MKTVRVAYSGSGFLAGLHGGASCALMDAGYQIAEVAGTSGGSIVAAAVALGMRQDDLRRLSVDTDMSGLLSLEPLAFLRYSSFCDGSDLLKWLDRTFSGRTCGQTQIPIRIIASDLSVLQPFVFGTRETPDAPLSLACRASSAVPVVFSQVKYAGQCLEDGGMCDNLALSSLEKQPGDLLIGCEVDTPATADVSTAVGRIEAAINLMRRSNEEYRMQAAQQLGALIVKAPSGGIGFLNTGLTTEQKQTLFDSGYAAMKAALS